MSTDGRLPTTSYALLGLLAFGEELSGYDLKKWADQSLRFFYVSPAHSHVYGELRRLAERGLVRGREVEQSARPDKVVYRITDDGLAELRRWLAEAPVEPPVIRHTVALRLFFGHLTNEERLREVLERYAAETEALLAELRQVEKSLTEPRWEYARLVARWGLRFYGGEAESVRSLLRQLARKR